MNFPFENLIDYINDGDVVPIIGRDLLLLEIGGETVPLYTYLARRLSNDLGFDPLIDDLNKVAIELKRTNQLDSVHTRVNRILNEERLPIPDPLCKLARIESFPLFVSLTFDTLLEQALNQERFSGEGKTKRTVYSCFKHSDLSTDYSFQWKLPTGRPPTRVFHLLGKHDSQPDRYAITEENLLEYFYCLQDTKPKRLLQGLCKKHLLILGCNLPDWLTRLLLRLVTEGRLSDVRNPYQYKFLADEGLRSGSPWSKSLVYFLENFSTGTLLYHERGPGDFVTELYRSWSDKRDHQRDLSLADSALTAEIDDDELTIDGPEEIFLSYAREDREAVDTIYHQLKGHIGVWYDKKLRPGDNWRIVAREKIKSCRFFMPVYSRQALDQDDSFFKAEWNWALKKAEKFYQNQPFFMPAIIDDHTSPDRLPEELHDIHVIKCPGGNIAPDDIKGIVEKYQEIQLRRSS